MTTAQEHSASSTQAPQRVIKKYPNRRLYDTATSTYITLAEVKQLVMARENIVVKDAKTGDELTRSILLQIILEEEAGGAPMFTEAMLANIIRFYGHAMQGHMGSYIEKNVQMLTDFQQQLAEQSLGGTAMAEAWAQMLRMPNPMQAMGSYAEQSQAMFSQMQEHMQKHTEQMLGMFNLKK